MKYFSMFSGIGGFELGIQQSHPDWECIGFSEIDKYAIQVYNNHFKHVNYGDATTINPRELPDFDLLVGGFPCQAFSIAGKRRGFDEARGTLFFEIARILRDKRPRYFVLENVKGLLSHDGGQTFQTILRVLTDLGYEFEWQVLNSKNFGVPQNRERIFIIGNLRGTGRSKVFPITRTSEQTLIQLKGGSQGMRVYGSNGIATTQASQAGGLGAKTGLYFIDLSTKQAKLTNEARTIQARYFKGYSHRTAETSGVAIPVLTPDRLNKRQNGRRFKTNGEPAFTLTGQDKHGIYDGYKIRRLTPVECARLQGFPDDWHKGLSDTQAYKCYGNAVTVNVINFIMKCFV